MSTPSHQEEAELASSPEIPRYLCSWPELLPGWGHSASVPRGAACLVWLVCCLWCDAEFRLLLLKLGVSGPPPAESLGMAEPTSSLWVAAPLCPGRGSAVRPGEGPHSGQLVRGPEELRTAGTAFLPQYQASADAAGTGGTAAQVGSGDTGDRSASCNSLSTCPGPVHSAHVTCPARDDKAQLRPALSATAQQPS